MYRQAKKRCSKKVVPVDLKKSVQFGPIKECPLEPLPLDIQIEALFYTADELFRQRSADVEAKRSAENDNSEFEEGEDICFRGLENSLNKGERRRKVQEYVRTVINVHREQREMGYFDDYELCLIAKARSKGDRKLAQRMASIDANEAFEDLSDRSQRSKPARMGLKRWVAGSLSGLRSAAQRRTFSQ
jgi:hypothetical protein